MRVIAGLSRGRQLKRPSNNKIRPTADRVKEALFSILTSELSNLSGLRVLDICAGTGNLGIESLSRGAAHAVFIDSSNDAVQLIQANLKLLGFSDKSTVLQMAAGKALNSLAKSSDNVFDLVFFDPPYDLAIPADILPVLGASALITETAYVVVEQNARNMLAEEYGRLQLVDRRIYGDTALFIYANGTDK